MENMEGPTYRVKRKRRRLGKTDYRLRYQLIRSEKIRAVIRTSLRKIFIHFSKAKLGGDVTVSYSTSSELADYGWGYNKVNLPAAYLTGFLAGLKAKKEGINKAIPDYGHQNNTMGNKLNAAVKGLSDAGINIPHSQSVLPNGKRISGQHIAKIAENLKQKSKERYKRQFSEYRRKGLNPMEIPNTFSQTLSNIAEAFGKEAPKIIEESE